MGFMDNLSPSGSIAIGIVVGLISTSLQSFGLTLQRKSHLLEDEKLQHEPRRPAYRRRRWQIGMLMFIIANVVGSTIQITTLPLPVLSTLQAAGLVFNTAFATLLLHEPFTRYAFVGTILVCGGAVLIGIFGAIGEPAHDLSQLLDLLGRPQFIAWMVVTLLAAAITMVLARFLLYLSNKVHEQHEYSKEQDRFKSSPSRSRSNQRIPSGSLRKRPTLPLNVPVPNSIRSSRLRMLRGLAYALISGILSAHSLLVAKAAVELIVRSLTPPRSNQFNRYQSWLALVALLFFALSQLYYLHQGLRLCSTSVLYPFVFCIYNIIAIIDGLVYFNQSSQLSGLHAGLIALGTIVLLGGVVSLSWRLEEIQPVAPATAPATTDPEIAIETTNGVPDPIATPSASTPSESTPLLSRRRRSTQASARQNRRPTLSLLPPHLAEISAAPSPTAGQIWAELDDSDTDGEDPGADYLASLPRTPIPFALHQPPQRRRKRGNSFDSKGTSKSRVSFADSIDQQDHIGGDERQSRTPQRNKRVVSAPPYSHPAANPNISPPNKSDGDLPAGESPPTPATSAAGPSRYNATRSPQPPPPQTQIDNEDQGDAEEDTDTGWTSAPKRWASWLYKTGGADEGDHRT